MATALASIAASVLAFQLGQLWLGVWESIRVRNGHISLFRAATWNRWPHQHALALLIGGIAVFWIVALSRHRPSTAVGVNTVAFACAMLGAMFVDVFVRSALGYAFVVALPLGMVAATRSVHRF